MPVYRYSKDDGKTWFSGEFDLQFKKALEEIEISESAAVETFEQTENGKLRLNMPSWSKDIALVVQKIA